MKLKLLLTLSIALMMTACASTPKSVEINNRKALKENHKRVYFTRSNTKIKGVEKGLGTAAKVGLGVLAVAVGAAAGAVIVPTYRTKTTAAHQNIIYDIYIADGESLTPYQSLSVNDQPLFVDFEKNTKPSLVLGVYNKSLIGRGYSSDIGLLDIEHSDDTVHVIAIGKQENPDGWGMRVLKLSNDDAEFCQNIQNQATTQKEVSEIIKTRSANYVAEDSNLKYSSNFTLACYTVLDAIRAAPYAGSGIRKRFDEKAEKLKSIYSTTLANIYQTQNSDSGSQTDKDERQKIISSAKSNPPILLTPISESIN